MSAQPLLATTTGELFQPARLHYSVRDLQRLEACFRKLRCMSFDEDRNRWVWYYDDEARGLKFKQSRKELSKHGAVVLGSFYIRGTSAAELYVRSVERALMAVEFFDEYVPRTVARITDMDVANRLYSADERQLTPETLFAAAETDLRQQAVAREALRANPQQMLTDFYRQYSGGERKQLPELERLPTNYYEDGIEMLTHTLRLRQHLAMQHWTGHHDVTMLDLIRRAITGVNGGMPPARTPSVLPGLPQSGNLTRINWNFGPEVPVRDFFESLDLSRPRDLSQAVEDFIHNMQQDDFRAWEAVIREEQGLVTMPVLIDLTGKPMSFEPVKSDPVYYIDDAERLSEPWYEILCRIATNLLIEPLRTADIHEKVLLDGWPRMAGWVEQRSRGLSLPEGVRRPQDVVPAEIRHRLWLQVCCEPLCGLGQQEGLTLAEEEEHWRVDRFLELLRRHRDSVEFLGLTLDGLLGRCELPGRDRPIFVRVVSDRLGLSGTDEPLAPRLEPAAELPDEPGEPIQQLSKEDIRQAILHSEPAVHRAAMSYFADMGPGDPGIAALVINAIQAMEDERDRTFAWICLSELAQTDETSEWILQELKALRSSGEVSDLDRYTVASALLAANPSFLTRNKRNILAAISGLDDLKKDVEAQIADLKLDVEQRWATFLDLVQPNRVPIDLDDFYPRREFIERMQCLIRAMGDDERPVHWVMETLPRTINDVDYDCGCELIAVSLCGVLELTAAIPYLIAVLHDDDREMVEHAFRSLSRIDGDAVIEALDRCFAGAGPNFQLQAAMVLKHAPSDLAIRTLQKWSRDTKDESAQCDVRRALLERFVTSEIDRTRQWMIDAKPTCEEVAQLRQALVATSLIAGRHFAELDDWLAEVREDLASGRRTEDMWDGDSWHEGEDEDWDEGSGTSGDPFARSGTGRVADDPSRDCGLSPVSEVRAAPITRSGQKVGRNDPCPCGSGKKYKKCCLKKQ